MSYTLVREDELKAIIYDSQHVTLFCQFMVNNTPVDVQNPVFRLYRDGVEVNIDSRILKPLQKDNRSELGKYVVTFLSSDLKPGLYSAKFSGVYNGQEVVVEKTLELRAVPRLQHFIDTLRGLMMAKYNLDIPRRYLTFDPTKKQWEDGDLYEALLLSLNKINEIVPITYWTFDDIPCPGHLLLGAQIYALTEVRTLEELNYFSITIPTKVDLYKGDKLAGLMSFISQQFYEPVAEFKRNWYINEVEPEAIVMSRVPIRILRPVSDELFFHTLMY